MHFLQFLRHKMQKSREVVTFGAELLHPIKAGVANFTDLLVKVFAVFATSNVASNQIACRTSASNLFCARENKACSC